jgi:ankyrin repeat protein
VLQEAASEGHAATVHLLLENGADIEAKSGNGEPVIISALVSGNEVTVSTVLEFGVDINSRDGSEHTALDWSTFIGREPVMRLLLSTW